MPKPFYPLWRNAHLQTIIASQCNLSPTISSQNYRIPTTENDWLTAEFSTPNTTSDQTACAILLHGLCGSSHAGYMRRTAHQLLRQGLPVLLLNFRGCDPHSIDAKGLAHAGRSEDLDACLRFMRAQHPHMHYHLIGFSLGGNVALKFLAEPWNHDNIHQAIAICPPVDLKACADKMEHPRNWIFRRYFAKRLNQLVQKRHQHYPELGKAPEFSNHIGFWEFDQGYTAPQSGFKNAEDYFAQCSTLQKLERIKLPCHILTAADDPFVDNTKLMRADLPDYIARQQTKQGGHMGFLGNRLKGTPYRWLDHYIMQRINA